MDVGLAAKKLGMSESRLKEFESGDSCPSSSQMEKVCKQFKRPLLTFYLETPPAESHRIKDFRSLSRLNDPLSDVRVRDLARDVIKRQSLLASLCEDAELPLVSFVGSLSANWQSSSTKEIAQQVAREIRFDLDAYRKLRTATEAFGYLKNKIEQTGVFVFFLSNLGSYHTDIPVSAFRGFALSDPRAPCIVVNSKDSHFTRVFTLLHELVHLWIGDTGISGAISGDLIAVEQFCNHVASEVLLPESALAYEIVAYEIDKIVQEKYPLSTLGLLSNKFNISKRMIVHRLWQAGHIDESTWLYLCEKLEEYWEDPRLKQGDQDVIMSTRLKIKETVGVGAMDLLAWGLRKNFISPVKAGTVVGQNPYAASRVLLDDAVHMNDPEYVWD